MNERFKLTNTTVLPGEPLPQVIMERLPTVDIQLHRVTGTGVIEVYAVIKEQEPNAETRAAIEAANRGELSPVDTSSPDSFLASIRVDADD
jgi:hypothetical protein